MKIFVSTSILGVFAFDSKRRLIHYSLFRPDPEFIAGRMSEVAKGEIIPEEEELLRELKKSGYKTIAWDKKVDFPDVKCLYEPENVAKDILKKEMRSLAMDLKFVDSQTDLNRILSQVNISLTKKEMRKEKKDVILMRAVGVVDELDKSLNTMSELMREWYGLHFPEADKLIRDHAQLAEIIHREGKRSEVKDKKLQKYAGLSAGMNFSDEDLKAIQEYAKKVHELYDLRDRISSYIKKNSRDYIPNLSAVAGPLIACRLISLAGSLEKLAKMPSSTIQLLGAEKALFRHLKSKDKPPKFGVIFAHSLIQNAVKNEKGRMARLLASKLSMAARADFYTGKDMSEKLLKDLRDKSVPRIVAKHKGKDRKKH